MGRAKKRVLMRWWAVICICLAAGLEQEPVKVIRAATPDDVRTTVTTTTTTTTITVAQKAGKKEKDEDIVFGKDKAGHRVPCGNFSRCDSCTAFDACVWCPNEKKCVPGGAKGPLAKAKAKCTGSFEHHTCQNEPCAYFNTCTGCTRVPICGWCAESYQCVQMTPDGKEDNLPEGEDGCLALLPSSCALSDAQTETMIDWAIANE